MSLTVDPGYLRGFARQLNDISDGPWAALTRYCDEHCKNDKGFDGILVPARAAVSIMGDTVRGLMTDGDTGFRFTAHDLDITVENYEKSDAEGADALWKALRSDWEMPSDYREQDVAVTATTFSSGPALSLPPPGEYSDAADYKKSVFGMVGSINSIIKHLTGYDVLEKVLPIVLGDSGAFRRLADAHRTMEHGIRAVKGDIEDGMDLLSKYWTSDGGDGASTAFDYLIRKRWVPALDAFAQGNDACQQIYDSFAAQYNYIVNSLLFALNFYFRRIKAALGNVHIFQSTFSMAKQIFGLVTSVIGLIVDAFRLLYKEIVMIIQGLEAIIAFLTMTKNIMRGDFNAFSAP